MGLWSSSLSLHMK
nr:uORF4 [Mus musculus]AAN17530.1 uORF2 [Mus musculus]AAN17537.1 uORF2 [Mus musculus]